MMQRTQIYLPKELKKKVTQLAADKGIPMAEIIRKAVEKEVEMQTTPKENPLIQLAKLKIKGGPRDLSSKFDEYLYGDK